MAPCSAQLSIPGEKTGVRDVSKEAAELLDSLRREGKPKPFM